MRPPHDRHVSLARRLFAAETRVDESKSDRGVVGGRLHVKLFDRLAGLVGHGGARALFRRSLRAARDDFPMLANVAIGTEGGKESAVDLASALAMLSGEAAEETTVALTAIMLGLLERLIGEPLTLLVLRREWPDVMTSKHNEEKKR